MVRSSPAVGAGGGLSHRSGGLSDLGVPPGAGPIPTPTHAAGVPPFGGWVGPVRRRALSRQIAASCGGRPEQAAERSSWRASRSPSPAAERRVEQRRLKSPASQRPAPASWPSRNAARLSGVVARAAAAPRRCARARRRAPPARRRSGVATGLATRGGPARTRSSCSSASHPAGAPRCRRESVPAVACGRWRGGSAARPRSRRGPRTSRPGPSRPAELPTSSAERREVQVPAARGRDPRRRGQRSAVARLELGQRARVPRSPSTSMTTRAPVAIATLASGQRAHQCATWLGPA